MPPPLGDSYALGCWALRVAANPLHADICWSVEHHHLGMELTRPPFPLRLLGSTDDEPAGSIPIRISERAEKSVPLPHRSSQPEAALPSSGSRPATLRMIKSRSMTRSPCCRCLPVWSYVIRVGCKVCRDSGLDTRKVGRRCAVFSSISCSRAACSATERTPTIGTPSRSPGMLALSRSAR